MDPGRVEYSIYGNVQHGSSLSQEARAFVDAMIAAVWAGLLHRILEQSQRMQCWTGARDKIESSRVDFAIDRFISSSHPTHLCSKPQSCQTHEMAVTPRRSTRGAIFTPSPHPAQAVAQANTTYHWLSAPLDSSSTKIRYNSFRRILHPSALAPRRGRKKVAKGDEESRFTVGDGVLVGVDGGDGVGVLIGLWQDLSPPEDDESDDDEDGAEDEEHEQDEEEEGSGKRMMAEVHWCFRRQDLPGVMKNLNVQDVSPTPLWCTMVKRLG